MVRTGRSDRPVRKCGIVLSFKIYYIILAYVKVGRAFFVVCDFQLVNHSVSTFYFNQSRIVNSKASLLSSEPAVPPTNVRGRNTSSTSILVTWDEVPTDGQNGIITSYTITYQSLTQDHNGHFTVEFSAHQTVLTGLKKYVNYSITVFASTVKGNGPASSPIIVSTDQDSKWLFCFINFENNIVCCD